MSATESPVISPEKILNKHKYIRLITYRMNGQEVATPVWFIINNSNIYLMTFEKAGKVKRIKNIPQVTVSPCTSRGKVIGQSFKAHATFVAELEEKKINNFMKKKYGIQYKFLRFLAKIRGAKYIFVELNPQFNN